MYLQHRNDPKSRQGFKRKLLNTSVLSSLLILMRDTRNENAGIAHQCFTELAGMQEPDGLFSDDPFTRVWNNWRSEDEHRVALKAFLSIDASAIVAEPKGQQTIVRKAIVRKVKKR